MDNNEVSMRLFIWIRNAVRKVFAPVVIYVSRHGYEVDDRLNIVHVKYRDGTECWYDYDIDGKLIHEKDSDGYERWLNGQGNRIHEKLADGDEF